MMDATSNSKQQLNEIKKVTTGEGACHAHGEADGDGEETEQNQVDRVLLVVEVERAQHCKTPKCNNIFSSAFTIRGNCTSKIQPSSLITMQLGKVTLTRTFPQNTARIPRGETPTPQFPPRRHAKALAPYVHAREHAKASPTRGCLFQRNY
jgi:hypothetical protein